MATSGANTRADSTAVSSCAPTARRAFSHALPPERRRVCAPFKPCPAPSAHTRPTRSKTAFPAIKLAEMLSLAHIRLRKRHGLPHPLKILPDSNVFHSRRYGAATSPIFHPHYRPSSAATSPLLLRLFPRLSERNCRYSVKLPSLCRCHAGNPAFCLTPKTHLCAGGIPLCTRPCIPRITPSPPPSVARSFRHKTTTRRRNRHTRARRFQRAAMHRR